MTDIRIYTTITVIKYEAFVAEITNQHQVPGYVPARTGTWYLARTGTWYVLGTGMTSWLCTWRGTFFFFVVQQEYRLRVYWHVERGMCGMKSTTAVILQDYLPVHGTAGV